ncbi:hypothetical protein CANINC_000820 [Pichia inconspicua]|uniref:HIT-type domain-containing protein n=1 Tax=Pichia inconspicua TaxID=52247 RepID=A0A4T0X721_9ASCO|nr:hypothetical protein CANINC_000820 [[Candida] inconspicua]
MTSKCEICEEVSKYVCPRCQCRTCSLTCFKKHKIERSCSGKSSVEREEFISKREIDENDVQRDYNFLLRMDRNVSLAKRQKIGGGGGGGSNNLRGWINQRGVRVRKVPIGMSRGKNNKSGWKGRGKDKEWFWSIEFVFGDEKCMKFRCNEKSSINECIPDEWKGGKIWVKDVESGELRVLSGDMRLGDALHEGGRGEGRR